VVAEQLGDERLARVAVVPEVERHHRERGERRGGERAARAGVPPQAQRERGEHQGVAHREQAQRRARRHGPRGGAHRVQRRRGRAQRVGPGREQPARAPAVALQRGAHHDGREEAERGERERPDGGERAGRLAAPGPGVGEPVDHEAARVPEQAEHPRSRAGSGRVPAPRPRPPAPVDARSTIAASIAYSATPVTKPTRWTSGIRSCRSMAGGHEDYTRPARATTRGARAGRGGR
jgi:hypothetical protein